MKAAICQTMGAAQGGESEHKDEKEKEEDKEENEKKDREHSVNAKETEGPREVVVKLHQLCETFKQQEAFNFTSEMEVDNMDTIMEVLKNTEADALEYNGLIQQSARVITFLR